MDYIRNLSSAIGQIFLMMKLRDRLNAHYGKSIEIETGLRSDIRLSQAKMTIQKGYCSTSNMR